MSRWLALTPPAQHSAAQQKQTGATCVSNCSLGLPLNAELRWGCPNAACLPATQLPAQQPNPGYSLHVSADRPMPRVISPVATYGECTRGEAAAKRQAAGPIMPATCRNARPTRRRANLWSACRLWTPGCRLEGAAPVSHPTTVQPECATPMQVLVHTSTASARTCIKTRTSRTPHLRLTIRLSASRPALAPMTACSR